MLKRSTIMVAAIAACGVTLALGASVVVQPRVVHPLGAVASTFQGWGMALAAHAIGVQCQALTVEELANVDAVVADARAKHLAAGPEQQRFFEAVYADLKRQYDGKYANPAHCTADSKSSARALADRARKYLSAVKPHPASFRSAVPPKFMQPPQSALRPITGRI